MLRDNAPSQGVPKLVRDTDNAQYGRDDELFYEIEWKVRLFCPCFLKR
jgi:hypothetical protein